MTENKRRPKQLKGVVLVMVVTLLFILIVMLMATLTVVGNANKRTVTKFEENQAYYTARSALGVYITGMLEMDETGDLGSGGAARAGKALSNKFSDVSQSDIHVFEKSPGSGQYADFGKQDPIVEGFVYQQELFGYLTPKYKLASLKRGEVLAAPTNDSNWTETEDWDNKPESQQNYRVTYKASLPNVNGVTGMGSNGNVGVLATEDVDITVELLRMVYMNKDDQIITDGTMSKTGDGGGPGTVVDAKLEDVDWSKTYYRLKVTSTAKIKQGTGGVNEGTVSVILEPKATNSPSAFTNALTTFEETAMDTKGFTVGGASAASPAAVGSGSVYTGQNNSTWVGSYVYRYDKVTTQTSGFTWKLFQDDSFIIQKGYFEVNNQLYVSGDGDINTTTQTDADGKKLIDKRPYVYAGGLGVKTGQFKMGVLGSSATYSNSAVDLILYHDDKFASDYNGNVSATVSNIGDTNKVKAEKVAYFENQDGEKHYYGDVYCDGDMYIYGKTQFHGNVYCTGSIILLNEENGSWKVEKDLKLGGSIYKADGTELTSATPPAGFTIGNHSANFTKNDTTLKGYYDDSSKCPWGNNWAADIDDKPTISFGGFGKRSDIPIRTVKKITETYRDSAMNIIPADEFIKKQTKQDKIELSVKNNAKLFDPNSTPMKTKDFTIDGSTVTLSNVIDPTDGSVATYNSDTDFYEMKLDVGTNNMMNNSNTYYLDATSGNIQIELSGNGQNMGSNFKLVVVGDSDVIFTIKDGDGSNNYVKIKGSILTYELDQMLQSNATFNLGDPETVEAAGLKYPKAPTIYYYFGENAVLDMYNADGQAWAGYMYGPEAKFNTNAGGIGKNIKYTYNTNPTSGNFSQSSVYCYGSMVFKEIGAQNDVGVAFIDPRNGGGGGAAKGKVIWMRQRYLNR